MEFSVTTSRAVPLSSFDLASEVRLDEQYNCFEALADTMRELATKPDLPQSDLFARLNPLVGVCVSVVLSCGPTRTPRVVVYHTVLM
jgi:hypothetical protein